MATLRGPSTAVCWTSRRPPFPSRWRATSSSGSSSADRTTRSCTAFRRTRSHRQQAARLLRDQRTRSHRRAPAGRRPRCRVARPHPRKAAGIRPRPEREPPRAHRPVQPLGHAEREAGGGRARHGGRSPQLARRLLRAAHRGADDFAEAGLQASRADPQEVLSVPEAPPDSTLLTTLASRMRRRVASTTRNPRRSRSRASP